MNKQELQELNKRLAEWAGFEKQGTAYWAPITREFMKAPDFTQSLDACFKWLVPKIIENADYSIIITQNLAQCAGYIRPIQGGVQYDAIDNQNPALALCLAIDKLINSEVVSATHR